MGLFDIFARKGEAALRKHAARAANKRAQNPDRWESIQALAAMKSPEAVAALLRRFPIRVDPSIVDQEEKDAAFQGIVETGDAAVQPVRDFMKTAESISWPMKILERLLPADQVVSELLSLLETMDTEYERDPEKKIQTISLLQDHADDRIVSAATRFLSDANETVRFHAVAAVLAQTNADLAQKELLETFVAEESLRCRARILDGFVARAWSVPDEHRDSVREKMPAGYALDPAGVPRGSHSGR